MRPLAAGLLAFLMLCNCNFGFTSVGSWTEVKGPAAALNGSWAIALNDGRVGVFGGTLTNGQPSFDTVLYDPLTGSWTKAAPMPGPAFPDVVALLAGGTVLVEGGRDADGKLLGDTWIFDPVHNSWSQAGSVIEPRSGSQPALLTDGRLMIAGGTVPVDATGQAQNGQTDFKPIPSVEIYDPATRKWSKAGNLNATRSGITLVPLKGGGALAAGGCQGPASWAPPINLAEVFDPAANTWTVTTPLPTVICGAGGAMLPDGRALVVDQYAFTGVARYFFTATDDAFIYDPKTRAWSLVGGLASGGTAALPLHDGRVLVPVLQTGEQQGRTFKELVGGQIYDPNLNEWTYVTTTTVTMPLIYMFNGVPPVVVGLADGTALVILQTKAVTFHPEKPPPPTQLLDTPSLTFDLGAAIVVIILLIVIAYRRASRADAMKLP